ncbi:F0F1 ATP synthase subunit epsilon [Mycoplasma bradburyae]|uniref:ATP synthase epsilon chain n=1 Tax=Mycoplasma bradburyae TaxID=2963128 RepID=A0AAW6HQS3_9MOLU|nr:F0F1 ATP synthase subunit epsilon [Mycoplasma bradburyae]MDC4163346.1 F0F1 ATP synthase subunit epsilon [Mycoplasma bradburyae]MDC4182663.1 F0F1 ATP synthase subunit epsilon [Mycoplasma bradburyae]MDC4183335.1 F0F1 ATP synthase subunit epsilon [Mycoplasma bradburyae]MDC4184143.1 F0F1 ATP synthase subunit epsilon [Mycoplasma bradburyae]UTS71109.1 F0F1 ATP synthase subunit epsilon [Mycoplasma bradburyae]
MVKLKVLSPKGVLFDEDIEMILVKGSDGYAAFMKNTEPSIFSIKHSIGYITFLDKTKKAVVIDDATLYSNKDLIRIFALDFIVADKLSYDEILENKKELENKMKNTTDSKEIMRLQHALDIELLKLKEAK